MAEKTRANLKLLYETGDTPTQNDFADLIDSPFSILDDTSDAITEGSTKLFLTTNERGKLTFITVTQDVDLDTVESLAQGALPASQKGANSGVASLDANGKLQQSQLPAISITEYLGEVADQTAMLSLSGQKGDWCIRTDTGTVFVIVGDDPSVIAGWQEIEYPASPVTSVNGETGAVTVARPDDTISIAIPVAETISITNYASEGYTIDTIRHKTNSGTCSFTVQISGTDVDTMPLSSTTTLQAYNPSTANVVAVGNNVTITPSSISSDCEFLTVTLNTSF
jgi:hypothetical protein